MQKLTRDALLARFHEYGAPSERWLVGGEFERHLLLPDGTPLPYLGDVEDLLRTLDEADHWDAFYEGEYPIGLLHPSGANITLEPGAQFELSGSPHRCVTGVRAEAEWVYQEIEDALAGRAEQIALGFTPKARIEDIPWVPKGRYVVMRKHLAETGPLAHHMMKGTAATQASYDFSDEADCARKVQLATLLGPLTTALFANSPFTQGRPNGWMSFRGHIWTKTDPRRTGMPEAASAFSFERWVDYLLDAPMMFIKRDAEWIPAMGRTFRTWMRDDDGPSWSDWDLHQTSVFPEVRVKQQIEVRGADCVPRPLAYAFCALFEGLFYDDVALDRGLEFAQRFAAHGTKEERFDQACRAGLEGEVGGRPLVAWGEEIAEIAHVGLQRCRPEDASLLEPLLQQIEKGESPAATLLRKVDGNGIPGILTHAAL